jgi:parvulin-like peptidyl-prolyl isomerase
VFNLAEARRRAGDFAAARAGFARVLELDPEFSEARTKLDALGGRDDSNPRLHLRIIVVPSRQAAETLRRRCRSGESFAELASRHSVHPSGARGGDLGEVGLADLQPALRAAAAQLDPGEVSAPLETVEGFVLLQRAGASE